MGRITRLFLVVFLLQSFQTRGQIYPVPGGPVVPGQVNCFSFNVAGVGVLYPPGFGPWLPFIDYFLLDNIITTHPQTLVITLISPSQDSLVLSEYNGAGGQNYINTQFSPFAWQNINNGSAPFSGTWIPEGGFLSVFDFTNADGVWQVCIEDTLTDTLTSLLPGPYMSSFGGGSMAFGTSVGPPPCAWTWNLMDQYINLCQGSSVDLTQFVPMMGMMTNYTINGLPVPNPGNVSSAGTYNLFMDDGFGCVGSMNVIITMVNPPVLGNDSTISICGSSVNLNPIFTVSGIGNIWYNAAGQNVSVSSVSTPGIFYHVGYTDTYAACRDTQIITVVSGAVSPGPNQNIDICSGTTVDLTTLYNTGSNPVTWTYGGSPVANPSAVSAAGTYIITMTSGNCSGQSQVQLNVNPAPALGADQSLTSCSNAGPVDLTSVFPTGSFLSAWDVGGVVVPNPAAITQSGTYHLVVTDVNGCTDDALANVTVNNAPVLGPNQSVNICQGASVDLTALYNLTGLTSTWTTSGNPVANPAAATQSGTYNLLVTDANGCTASSQVMVAYSQAIALGAAQSVSFCTGQTADLTSLYNTAGMSTTWQTNGMTIPNPAAVSVAGAYTLTATNASGCTGTAQVTVTALTSPQLPQAIPQSICNNASIDLTSLYPLSGLNSTWTYNNNPISAPVAATQNGTYQVTATAANGCSAVESVVLNVLPAVNLGPDLTIQGCDGDSVSLGTLFPLAGTTAGWTLNNQVYVGSTATTTGFYEVIAVNAGGCSDTAGAQINFAARPVLIPVATQVSCNGLALDLSTLANYPGSVVDWLSNSQPVSNTSAVTASGNYEMLVTNTAGCTSSQFVNVVISPAYSPGTDQAIALCPWMTADLNSYFNLSGLNASWTWNGAAIANVSSVSDSGLYLLTTTNADGCTGTAEVLVTLADCKCVADFSVEGACTENPFTFRIIADSAILSAQWDFGGLLNSDELQPVITVPASGDSITVVLDVQLSCGNVTVTRNIYSENCSEECNMYFPQAFSPNRDGLNDLFAPVSSCEPLEYHMQVINRFGEVVFSSDSVSSGWNGGEEEPVQGLYVYKVSYHFPYQKEKSESGRITVVR